MTLFRHRFDYQNEDSPDKAFLEKCCQVFKDQEAYLSVGNSLRILNSLWYTGYKDKELLKMVGHKMLKEEISINDVIMSVKAFSYFRYIPLETKEKCI